MRLLGVNALQLVDRCPRMVTQIFRYPLLMDQPAVYTRPNNVALGAHYPLAKLRVLTRVLRTITKHAHLSFEMTGIVGALFAFRQALGLLQTLAFLTVLRKLFFLSVFHFFRAIMVVLPPRERIGTPCSPALDLGASFVSRAATAT